MLIEILSAPYDVGERTARLSASVGCSLYSFRRGDDGDPGRARPRPRSTTPSARAAAAWWSSRARWRRRPSASPASSRRCAAPSRPARWSRISSRSSTSGHRRAIGFEALARWTDRDLGAGVAGRVHPDRRGARHHRAAVAAGAAQGDGGGAQLAEGAVPVVQPVALAARRPEHRRCTSWPSSIAPASTRAGWRSRSPRPA